MAMDYRKYKRKPKPKYQPKKVPQKRLDDMRTQSNKCFEDAQRPYLEELRNGDHYGKEKLARQIDMDYRANLCKLPTDILEDAVQAHKAKQMRRAAITLDAIQKELANRALLEAAQCGENFSQ